MPEEPAIAIARVDPRLPAVAGLVRELDEYMTGLYPAESNHLVDIDTLAQPAVRFFAVTVDGEYCGCGAIMLRGRDYAEVKRVYVRASRRGLGLGDVILKTLEATARNEGIALLRLETGTLQPGALRLFEDAGFVRCGPFGDYPTDDPYSVFMEKAL